MSTDSPVVQLGAVLVSGPHSVMEVEDIHLRELPSRLGNRENVESNEVFTSTVVNGPALSAAQPSRKTSTVSSGAMDRDAEEDVSSYCFSFMFCI